MDGLNQLRTLRWEQYEYYDIQDDAEKLRVMGISNVGTWHTDIKLGSAAKVRTCKAAFEQYVLGALSAGLEPSEVVVGD